MIHHSIDDHVQHTVCPSCGKDHNARFFSRFTEDKHYIVGNCASCGYEIEIRRDDLGSGLFMPDGNVSTVGDVFRKESVGHVREYFVQKDVAEHSHAFGSIQMRFLDPKAAKKTPAEDFKKTKQD